MKKTKEPKIKFNFDGCFDGNVEHSGTSCTNQKRRIVLNIDYIDKNQS